MYSNTLLMDPNSFNANSYKNTGEYSNILPSKNFSIKYLGVSH